MLAFVLFILACISQITAQVFFFFITCIVAFFSLSFIYRNSKEMGIKKYIASTLVNIEVGSNAPMVINSVDFIIYKTPYLFIINGQTFKSVSAAVEYIYYTAHDQPAS